jgi:hypothetical protein
MSQRILWQFYNIRRCAASKRIVFHQLHEAEIGPFQEVTQDEIRQSLSCNRIDFASGDRSLCRPQPCPTSARTICVSRISGTGTQRYGGQPRRVQPVHSSHDSALARPALVSPVLESLYVGPLLWVRTSRMPVEWLPLDRQTETRDHILMRGSPHITENDEHRGSAL